MQPFAALAFRRLIVGLAPLKAVTMLLRHSHAPPEYDTTLVEALFGMLMGTLEFGLSSSDDEVMGASVDALAVLARHQVASLETGQHALRPTASSGACARQIASTGASLASPARDKDPGMSHVGSGFCNRMSRGSIVACRPPRLQHYVHIHVANLQLQCCGALRL